MSRRLLLLVPLFGLALLTFAIAQPKQKAPAPQWVWFDEGNPLSDAPAADRFFRRTLTLDKPVTDATIEVAADNQFALWVNAKEVGGGNDWGVLSRFDLKSKLVAGKNVLAIRATNEGGPAGLVVRLRYTPQGGTRQTLVSDGAWRTAKAGPAGWTSVGFDDAKWGKAKLLGEYGKVGPWAGGGGGGSSGKPTFSPMAGFEVVPAVKNPGDRGAFSLVNMTFDPRGRLLVAHEGKGILLCTKPDKDGVMQEVADYCMQIKTCHGMCWVDDALLLIGDGPKGTGLYRCKDTKGADKIDEVTLLQRFNGGMGEHGPHAIVHGPDDQLYVVIGNHAHAAIGPKMAPNPAKIAANSPLMRWPTGGQSPDQGKPGSCEDVLLPRLDDANGHAAGLRAPGGTIWRMDKQGKNMALVAAGFRNQFDAAFSPSGELFSFDSDMEWDEGLPWYRAVRAIHCIPGADFVWRTGAANTPNYYLDSLPPLAETGRGSPVGVAFYDHSRFGPEYRGAYFMADWSLGIIYAVKMKRKGATYEPTVEKFVTGRPMNVTDLEVAPDGSIVFTTGGRGSAGGVYRIVPKEGKAVTPGPLDQPLAAWSRAARRNATKPNKDEVAKKALAAAGDAKSAAASRVRSLMLMQIDGLPISNETLLGLAKDSAAEVRAQAVCMLGLRKGASTTLIESLRDDDALVRRRACEALVRSGVNPKVDAVWPLLADGDRFVRTAARLVLQRIDPKEWAGRIAKEPKDGPAREAIVALCKIGEAADHADVVFARLDASKPMPNAEMLDHARTIQLACFHTPKLPEVVKDLAAACDKAFPHADPMVNRELAIVLTHLRRVKMLETPVQAKLLAALEASKGDKQQQIHYFYCLRLINDGWTPEEHARLATWYDSTRDWSGGASYRGFLANIFRDCLSSYTPEGRKAFLASGEKTPHATLALVQRLGANRQKDVLPEMRALLARAEKSKGGAPLANGLRDAIVLCAAEKPTKEAFPDLVTGLSSANKVILFEAIAALRKIDARPKAEDGKPYRALLAAAGKLDAGNRWKAVELLRHWSGDRRFGADEGKWQLELASWSRWFAQAFPKEPALPATEFDKPAASKYAFNDLLAFVTTGEGKNGDVAAGRKAFEKASCVKCHKFGKEGEGLGPDLSAVSKRFKRFDILESIYYPSKVISDQYRSTSIVTTRGQRIDGLVSIQGDAVTVLQSDGTKATLRKKDIDQQFSSLTSVMPEKLLDQLTKKEIADLFAFLESDPAK